MAQTTGVMNGKLLGVYVDGTLVATGKSCKLTVTHEVRDTFSKDDAGWKTNKEGARSWKVDVDGMVTQTNFSVLYALVTNRTQVELSFQSSEVGDQFWRGNAFISSLDQSADNETSVTYTASFDGDGVLTQGIVT